MVYFPILENNEKCMPFDASTISYNLKFHGENLTTARRRAARDGEPPRHRTLPNVLDFSERPTTLPPVSRATPVARVELSTYRLLDRKTVAKELREKYFLFNLVK